MRWLFTRGITQATVLRNQWASDFIFLNKLSLLFIAFGQLFTKTDFQMKGSARLRSV